MIQTTFAKQASVKQVGSGSSSAVIPNIYGPDIDAEMTYYETSAGAMVFDAGALSFGASVLTDPSDCLLQNVYNHLYS